MSSYRSAIAAGFVALIGAATSPAHAAIIGNALPASGSPLDELNGVAVQGSNRGAESQVGLHAWAKAGGGGD